MKINWNEALALERDVAVILQKQAEYGIHFDIGKAHYLISELDELKESEYNSIRPYLKPVINILETKIDGQYSFVNKIQNKDGSYTRSVLNFTENPEEVEGPFTRISISEPEISKRQDITKQLLDLGWKPKVFTETGQPKLTDKGEPVSTLEKVGSFGKSLSNWYIYSHRQSQIQGFLEYVREDGRISSQFSGITNTYRHKHKIVANIPRPTSIFGKEMRSLFSVGEGRAFVGCDVSGLELRMLAHYMNDPEYISQVLEGDIHLYNLSKTGNLILSEGDSVDLSNLKAEKDRLKAQREIMKTFIYGFLYGSGDEKAGSILGKSSKEGKELKNKFLSELPALSDLINKVKRIAEKYGYVPSIDNRPLRIRSYEGKLLIHTALNTLLQGSGSIVTKRAMVIADQEIKRLKLDARQIIFYHDEFALDCQEDIGEEVGKLLVDSIRKAGEYYNLRIPLTGEYGIGKDWGVH